MERFEKQAFEIIGASGESRTEAFSSLRKAREGDIKGAREILRNAKKNLLRGHEIQSQLIRDEVNGEAIELNLLIIHAQDHLMNSSMTCDLIEEIIELCGRERM